MAQFAKFMSSQTALSPAAPTSALPAQQVPPLKKARISLTEAVPEDLDIPEEVGPQDDEVSVGSLMEGEVSEEEQNSEPPGTHLFRPVLKDVS